MEDNIKIIFELKSPNEVFQSQFNTLVIDLRDLYDLKTHHYVDEPTIKYQNKLIDDMILELQTMKYVIEEE